LQDVESDSIHMHQLDSLRESIHLYRIKISNEIPSIMTLRNKILKSGDFERISRFHTLRGQRIPTSEIFAIPFELLLRIFNVQRKGPWISKPAIRLMSRLISEKQPARILEIGGGRSSRYFLENASSLVTIEEDEKWASRIADLVTNKKCKFEIQVTNVELWLNTRNKKNMDFDIVLIDGSADEVRKLAIENLPSLNKSAVYILDNSDRKVFENLNFVLEPKKIVRKYGLVRHPFQATETTFYWFQ